MQRSLQEAAVTINDIPLSAAQSATLRVALICALADFKKLGPDITTAGHVLRIDEMLNLIDQTRVTI